ncbi:unannotated protein [freshwater metagenome]|uniref:Unannotated protein n=1 Tax=freshwater metagenome TaxID=449393 RepID=A0A6J6T085_9ZZZZ
MLTIIAPRITRAITVIASGPGRFGRIGFWGPVEPENGLPGNENELMSILYLVEKPGQTVGS